MKEKFDQIEGRLQRLIEKNMARLFNVPDVESKLAEKLAAAMKRAAREDEAGGISAPNRYIIATHPETARRLRSGEGWLEKFETILYESAIPAGIAFPSPPSIDVIANPELAVSEFEVQAAWMETELGETTAVEPAPQPRGAAIPSGAFLIVEGGQIFPLDEEVISIGRKQENQLPLDDQRVSRKHAQLRATRGEYVLFDLDSTGGTFVNGERVSQATLQSGDVISLGGVEIVYGQDAVKARGETEDYLPEGEKSE